ncbi:MAG: ABC transporter permease subunit [Bacilli bacterium]|nr:ABC transporter permease subunit [Bacilli bacterium]
MSKKIKENEIENLFKELNDDPRVVDSVPVAETIDPNYDDLFTVVGPSVEESERLDSAPYSYWRLTFKQLAKNPLVILCVVVLAILLFFIIFGTTIRYYPPMVFEKGYWVKGEMFGDKLNGYVLGPNPTNWFGVCAYNMGGEFEGLDMWSCVWKGSQLSLLLGVTVALIDTVLGIIIGSLWGYFRWLDPILIEFRNFVNNIPTILLDILLMQLLSPYMGQYGFLIIVMLLCALGWLGLAGFIRNQIIIIRNREYNVASQTLGSSSTAMITHNLLPYLVSVIVTVVSTAIPQAISSEVGLAFFNLSFKITDGDVTLGQVLTKAVNDITWMEHPYLLLAPLVVMAPLTICFFYLGLALSDATDPKTHR